VKGRDCDGMAQDKKGWRAVLNMTMHFRVQ
jgi:hypothetical protein